MKYKMLNESVVWKITILNGINIQNSVIYNNSRYLYLLISFLTVTGTNMAYFV